MIKARKKFLPLAAGIALAALSGTAWAGVTKGVLNSENAKVDLSDISSYEGSAEKPVILHGKTAYLTNDLILGDVDDKITGYAQQPLNIATESAAGGAILVKDGQTLNIIPDAGEKKKVSGRSPNKTSGSLRLFGNGTTNLSGDSNSYSNTFLQSGRLNVASPGALGGSKVTLAGGSSFGIVGGAGELDLSGVSIELTRYDPGNKPAKSVTFDTGTKTSNAIKVGSLRQTERYNKGAGGEADIELIKDGQGTLLITGVTNHSGGALVNAGTLELSAAPAKTQVIEIRGDAALASNVALLPSITVKPHSGAILSVPTVKASASLTSSNADSAALTLAGIDKSALGSAPFRLKANLDGLTNADKTDQDVYYVKLLNSPSHGLAAKDVTIEAGVPDSFSLYVYSVETFVDQDNVYALLRKGEDAYTGTLDVSIFGRSQQGSVITVAVATKSGKAFASSAGFKYRFVDADGYPANDPLRDAIFAAAGVQYNQSRTKASFQIDLSRLKDEKGVPHVLIPGRRYEIAVEGTGGASGSMGASVVPVNSGGEALWRDYGKYVVTIKDDVIVDSMASTIKPSVILHLAGESKPHPSADLIPLYFTLCDAFGDPVRINGKAPETIRALSEHGVATATFKDVPPGRYVVRVSSSEFQTVKYSGEVVMPGSGGGGGGCDAGAGIFGLLAATGAAALIRRKG
ncbi:MAG: hypothetical protein LBF92_02495 [Synergistaceae bacterium]|nr:hypothetical protein [Synergistaceae bacterium]